jgi:ligand-binding SRPBCC domain-containing protein
MGVHVLEREQFVPRPVDQVFAFFAQARNLERITPPWLRFEVLTPGPIEMGPGTLIRYRLRVHAVPVRWSSRRPASVDRTAEIAHARGARVMHGGELPAGWVGKPCERLELA